MSPENLQLISSVISLTTTIIQNHIAEQNELLELFTKASDEGRDLTDAEVDVYKRKAEVALASMQEINPLI